MTNLAVPACAGTARYQSPGHESSHRPHPDRRIAKLRRGPGLTRPPPAALPDPAAATSGWLALPITLAIQALVSMAVLALPVMAPAVAQSLGVSATLTGVYIALVYVGAMVASLWPASGGALRRHPGQPGRPAAVRRRAGCRCCRRWRRWHRRPADRPGLRADHARQFPPADAHHAGRTACRWCSRSSRPACRWAACWPARMVPSLLLLGGWQAALLAVAAANVVCALIAQPLRAELDADRQPGRPLEFGNLVQPDPRSCCRSRALAAGGAVRSCSPPRSCALTTYLVTYLQPAWAMAWWRPAWRCRWRRSAASRAACVGLHRRPRARRAPHAGGAGRIMAWQRSNGAAATAMPLVLVLVLLSLSAPRPPAGTASTWPKWRGCAARHGRHRHRRHAVDHLLRRGARPGRCSARCRALFGSYSAGYLALAVPTALCCWGLYASTRPPRNQAGPAA